MHAHSTRMHSFETHYSSTAVNDSVCLWRVYPAVYCIACTCCASGLLMTHTSWQDYNTGSAAASSVSNNTTQHSQQLQQWEAVLVILCKQYATTEFIMWIVMHHVCIAAAWSEQRCSCIQSAKHSPRCGNTMHRNAEMKSYNYGALQCTS